MLQKVNVLMVAGLGSDPDDPGTPSGFDASLVSYKAPALPNNDAVARSLRDLLYERISVKDFGAVGDGSTDDTAAIVKAFAAVDLFEADANVGGVGMGARGAVYFPRGIYKITSTINLTSWTGAIFGDGAETSIIMADNCDAINIDNSAVPGHTPRCVRVADMSFVAKSVAAYTGLRLKSRSVAGVGKQFTVEGVQFRGRYAGGNTTSWRYGIVMTNAHYTDIVGCLFVGSSANFDMVAGVSINANSVDVKIERNGFYHLHMGVQMDSGAPDTSAAGGVVVAHNHFVVVSRGVDSTNNSENFIVVSENHIAATRGGVRFGNSGSIGSSHGHVCKNLIFKIQFNEPYGPTYDFVGIEIHTQNNVVEGNTIINFAGTATSSNGIVIADNADPDNQPMFNRIVNNLVYAVRDSAFWTQPSTRDNQFSGNMTDGGTSNLKAVLQGTRNNLTTVDLRGALVSRATNLAVASGTSTSVSWNSTQYDTTGFFSSGAPTRITVPAGQGIRYVELQANITWQANNTGGRSVALKKNGADFYGSASDQRDARDATSVSLHTAPIPVTDGDYFEVVVSHDAGTDINVGAWTTTNFSVRVVG